MKKILLFIVLLLPFIVDAQTVGYFRYDTARFYKQGGTTNLKVEGRGIIEEFQLKSGGAYSSSFTIPSRRTGTIYLENIGSDQNITFPALTVLDSSIFMVVMNLNNSGFAWNVIGSVTEANGDPVTTIPKGMNIFMFVNNTWHRHSSGGGGGSGDTLRFAPPLYVVNDSVYLDQSALVRDTFFVALHGTSLWSVLYPVYGARDSLYCCEITGGGGGGGNIYNMDSTLSSNRTVQMAGRSLLFQNLSGNGPNVFASGIGFEIQTNGTDPVLQGWNDQVNSNSAVETFSMKRTGSLGSSNGLGQYWSFKGADAGSTQWDTHTLKSFFADVTPGSVKTTFSINGIYNNTQNDWFTLKNDGALQLNRYGSGTHTGTPAYTLQVDASGNVIEGSAAGGTGTVTNVATGYGLSGGPITTTGTVLADTTNQLASKLRLYKVADSLGAKITLGPPTTAMRVVYGNAGGTGTTSEAGFEYDPSTNTLTADTAYFQRLKAQWDLLGFDATKDTTLSFDRITHQLVKTIGAGDNAFDGDRKIKIFAGIIRPDISAAAPNPIRWEWLYPASDHDTVGFSAPISVVSSTMTLYYRTMESVLYFAPTADDEFAKNRVNIGASVGTSEANVTLTTQTRVAGYIRGNGTTWVLNGALASGIDWAYSSGNFNWAYKTGITHADVEAAVANYEGTNGYTTRRVLSGIPGPYTASWALTDQFGNTASITPQTTDVVTFTSNGDYNNVISIQNRHATITDPYITTGSAIFVMGIFQDLANPNRLYGPITTSNITTTAIQLDWTAATGGTGTYTLERSTTQNFGSVSTVYSGTALTYTDTGLTTGTTYYYRLRHSRTSDSAKSDMLFKSQATL